MAIQKYFNVGSISKVNTRNSVEFRVSKLQELLIIISHIEKHSLLTNKYSDFKLFKNIHLLLLNNEHNTLEGLQKIVNYRASLNWGLPEILKESFPQTLPAQREKFNYNIENILPDWVSGFCTPSA